MRLPRGLERPNSRTGFTLVELLVVIGIIALLIAILIPALSRARSAALVVKCLAVERAMGQAAQLHANEHKGYMPIAGIQPRQAMGVICTPEGLRDAARQKYMYYRNSDYMFPVPLTVALGYYMGAPVKLGDESDIRAAIASDFVQRLFVCPAQDPGSLKASPTIYDDSVYSGLPVKMSYVFNCEILGWRPHPWALERSPAGKLTAIRRPEEVFLLADGNCSGVSVGMQIDAVDVEWTLRDHWLRYGATDYWDSSSTPQLDGYRHRARINVLFVDWHAETLTIPPGRTRSRSPASDLDRAGINKGVYP